MHVFVYYVSMHVVCGSWVIEKEAAVPCYRAHVYNDWYFPARIPCWAILIPNPNPNPNYSSA